MKTPSNEELFEFFRNLKHNPKAIMVIAASIFFLDAAFLLRGQIGQVGRMFKEARTLKNEYKNAALDVQFAATYRTRLENMKTEEATLGKQIPPQESIPTILETVSKFADVSGVELTRIKPIPDVQAMAKAVTISVDGKQEEKIFREKIALNARSGYHQFGRFVAFLENAPNFFEISSVEIRTDARDYMEQAITMVIEVAVRKG
ncbi:MAG: type 4a pilus biogenesis protein PilO [Candidatus Omnitrophica bacterium]|nr:type 4a pilus biogenesis protein PilO [Candidatus Omnitrophota bacterium]MDD5573785.1 type 4a pilus biogenesis protein PilO [Candidatus Omnitrophota bacterium]